MHNIFPNTNRIFELKGEKDFLNLALEVFRFQYLNVPVYQQFVDALSVNPSDVSTLEEIPFLPISFFKSHQVLAREAKVEKIFSSSGTTGMVTSKHLLADLSLYEQSFLKAFELMYGSISNFIVLGLLPSYLEREGSSLIYMVDKLIQWSRNSEGGFYLNEYDKLIEVIQNNKQQKKILLIGVSYALLDLAEQYHPDLSDCVVMETGGMKGKRKEIPKVQLHQELQIGLNVGQIHSEYGMTELLSQGYSQGNQKFVCPPWMKILIREYNDPLTLTTKKSGGINVIDLANVYSCAFISTQDLGRYQSDGFEVLGRFDQSDVRGCNLLVQ